MYNNKKISRRVSPSSLNIRRTFGRCAGPSLRLGRASVMSVARQPWSATVCFCLFSGGCWWWWLVLRLVPRRLFSFKLCRTFLLTGSYIIWVWDVSWRAAAAAGTSLCNQETKRNEKKSVCALFCFPGVFFWPCARVYTSRRGAHV